MKNMQNNTISTEDSKASQTFVKVAPYLYRSGAGMYYGRKKHEGKLHRRSLDTDDFEKSKRELKKFLDEIEDKTAEKPDVKFEEVGEQWLASLYELKPSSKLRRETSLKCIKPTFQGKEMRSISKHQLTVWAAARSKVVTARTFNIDRETLCLVFEYAKETLGIIKENPAEKLSKMKAKRVQVTPPTQEQFLELVAFLDKSKRLNKDNPRRNAALFVRFLAYTGMRIEEARCVLWKDVNFAKGTLRITGGDLGNKNHNERTIPLFGPVRELLEENFVPSSRHPNSTIFDLYTAKEVLKTASKAMGLKKGQHFTHHDMRHFFCTNAIEQNIPDHVIAAWVGHKDGGVLVKTTYGHLRKTFSDAEALKMNFKG